jgi:hypothetical protein
LGKAWALNLAIALGRGLPFFSWLQDQLWKNLLQLLEIMNPEKKHTKVNWTLSWPSALEICGKTIL